MVYICTTACECVSSSLTSVCFCLPSVLSSLEIFNSSPRFWWGKIKLQKVLTLKKMFFFLLSFSFFFCLIFLQACGGSGVISGVETWLQVHAVTQFTPSLTTQRNPWSFIRKKKVKMTWRALTDIIFFFFFFFSPQRQQTQSLLSFMVLQFALYTGPCRLQHRYRLKTASCLGRCVSPCYSVHPSHLNRQLEMLVLTVSGKTVDSLAHRRQWYYSTSVFGPVLVIQFHTAGDLHGPSDIQQTKIWNHNWCMWRWNEGFLIFFFSF